ncbi:MAG: FAD-dependent thymidylate synthase [Candidatus Diapherotrites archaeon]|nr:FAD-dependent thymidylate synthase [Candidatus Diapherotrites archaeon]
MHVELINYTPDPERTCAVAAYASTHEKLDDEMFKNLDRKRVERVLRNIISRGHLSVIEHASFTFNISGVSRVVTHELVRHRLASYTQQSQRYVKLGEGNYTIPDTIKENPELLKAYKETIDNSFESYKNLLEQGIPAEDARYVLPNATHTSIVVTMNARSLLHFFTLRCCYRAQWEIRQLADAMLAEVKKVAPVIFEKAGPPCIRGPCPEGKFTCGTPRNDEPLFASAKK